MLVTTSFSMPESVIPFKLSPKSFIISIFIIAACIQLASVGVDFLSSWWKTVGLPPIAGTSTVIGISMPNKFRYTATRRQSSPALDGIDLDDHVEQV